MKKKCSLSFLTVLCLFISGCGSAAIDDYATNKGYESAAEQTANAVSDTDDTIAKSEEPGSTPKEESPDQKGIPKEELKIGVLHLTDPSEGNGYTYMHDLGIQGMQQNLGLADDQIVRQIHVTDTDDQAIEDALRSCIDEGCNVIFSTSWGYMDKTAELAEEYPDIYFAHATGYKSNGRNFTNYFGRIYQARYISGIVAGLNTSADKIGYVAAMDSSNAEVTGGIDAFALGIYAVNPDARVYVKVTNSWFDPEGERAAAEALLDLGCDIIAQHCDTPNPMEAAQQRGAYGIGYNSDMSKAAPNACLTSVIWNWSTYYTQAVESIMEGTYDGGNYYGGMAENMVGLTALSPLCTEETAAKVEEETNRILSGSFNVFDGVMETNTGETVGEEGKTLDDAAITGGINWYFKTVTVVE